MIAGDKHGENTLEHQPQKIAAIEGAWPTRPPGSSEPMVVFGVPDMREHRNRFEVAIPRVASLYLRHNLSGTVRGLDDFPSADIPPVPVVFFAFRLMVGLGLLMIAAGVAGAVLRWRGRLYRARWLQQAMVGLTPSGFVAMLAGWVVTEVGRQPFTVYGLLRTAQSVSLVAAHAVAGSAFAIVLVYVAVFGIGFGYLWRLVSKPAQHKQQGPHPGLVERLDAGRHQHKRERERDAAAHGGSQ